LQGSGPVGWSGSPCPAARAECRGGGLQGSGPVGWSGSPCPAARAECRGGGLQGSGPVPAPGPARGWVRARARGFRPVGSNGQPGAPPVGRPASGAPAWGVPAAPPLEWAADPRLPARNRDGLGSFRPRTKAVWPRREIRAIGARRRSRPARKSPAGKSPAGKSPAVKSSAVKSPAVKSPAEKSLAGESPAGSTDGPVDSAAGPRLVRPGLPPGMDAGRSTPAPWAPKPEFAGRGRGPPGSAVGALRAAGTGKRPAAGPTRPGARPRVRGTRAGGSVPAPRPWGDRSRHLGRSRGPRSPRARHPAERPGFRPRPAPGPEGDRARPRRWPNPTPKTGLRPNLRGAGAVEAPGPALRSGPLRPVPRWGARAAVRSAPPGPSDRSGLPRRPHKRCAGGPAG
jgi:hypothetical protein